MATESFVGRPLPSAIDLLTFAGWPTNDPSLAAQADAHLKWAAHAVWAYSSGRAFNAGGNEVMIDSQPGTVTVRPDVVGVILGAAARSLSNPTQARRVEAGSYSELPGSLTSFSLLEQQVLNRYRRRAA
jgi:hypothetical protein